MTSIDSIMTETVESNTSPLGSPDEPATKKNVRTNRHFHGPLVASRVGLLFVGTAVALLVLALIAHASPTNVRLHSILWVVAITVCAFGGLTSLGSVRTLRTIELELRRIAYSPKEVHAARPIIGSDVACRGWNSLLRSTQSQACEPNRKQRHSTIDVEAVTLARAMRGLPIAWVITRNDGSIRFLSPAACGLLGLDESADHLDRDLPQMIGLRDKDDESAVQLLGDLLSSIRMVHARRSVLIGSTPIDLRITRSILDGRSGDGKGLAWVLDDITQQQLATRSRDQFLMTATHELRTPLNNLQGYAEALQSAEHLDVEHQKEFCNIIVSESHRLGRLVDQMLSVGQMEAGSMIANRHDLEILPVVQYAIEQMGGHADQKRIKLVAALAPKLPSVVGDRDKLQAALVNLVGNAVKYTEPEGEVVVRANVEDRWIRIDIQDNGRGIPADEQPKVFDKFFRGSSAEQSGETGNGLGLAFVKEVARLHGGDVSLESNVGEGSTFTLRLPVGGESRSGI